MSAGSQHALALTASGQVYGWGSNSRGQSNPFDSLAVVLYPTKFQFPRGETARDILAEGARSVVVCDSGNVYYTGVSASSKSRLHCLKLDSLKLPPDTQPASVLVSGTSFVVNTRNMSR